MPAHAKDPSVRARRNKTTTKAKLKQPVNPKVPPLPTGTKWYPEVRDWWKRAWSSPMRGEWADADVDMLYLAAKLQQAFWDPQTSVKDSKALAGEVRLIMAHCGLSPMARRSLQWELPADENPPASSTTATPTPRKRSAKKTAPDDPRHGFRVVNGGVT